MAPKCKIVETKNSVLYILSLYKYSVIFLNLKNIVSMSPKDFSWQKTT